MVAQALIPIPRHLTRGQRKAIKAKARRVRTIPEYLEKSEIDALLACCPPDDPRRQLLILLQWRAGLRRTEACSLARSDLFLDGDPPTLKVRQGKGNKARIVPVHPELRQALAAYAWARPRQDTLLEVTDSQAWRWVKAAAADAVKRGLIPAGRRIATHTLRHSAARHWLANGVPINVVSRWLGHSSLQTTLVYTQILPDPVGHMERVP